MTTICLIRHGETEWNKKLLIQGRIDNPLNETGIKQAYATANILKEHDPNFDIILSSPLTRAKQTANIFKEVLNIAHDLEIIPNAIERDFGKAEGCNIEPNIYEKIKNDDVIGLEQTKTLQQRAYNTVLEIAKMYPNKRIILATHSHFIKGFFTYVSTNYTFTSNFTNCGLNYVYVENNDIIGFYDNKKYN